MATRARAQTAPADPESFLAAQAPPPATSRLPHPKLHPRLHENTATSLASEPILSRGRPVRRESDRVGGQRAQKLTLATPDNPLFHRLHAPGSPGTHSPSPTFTAGRNDPQQPWPPPRKESLTVSSPTPWVRSKVEEDRSLGPTVFEQEGGLPAAGFARLSDHEAMESLNIAVIGADGVGKSAFVQRALRLARPPSINVNSCRQEIDGTPFIVTLVELDLESFDVGTSQPIQWPKQIEGHMVPRVDGALVLYDVMNKESVRDLPPAIAALEQSSVPTILVATKCDTPENVRQLDTAGVSSAFPWCICDFKVSFNVPRSAQECLQAMLKATLADKRGPPEKSEGPASRRRAASAANLDMPQDTINGRPISQQSKHSRASSDLSLLRGSTLPGGETYSRGQSRSPRLDYLSEGLYSAPYTGPITSPITPDTGRSQTVSSMLRTPGIRLDAGQHDSFPEVEESDADSYRYSDDIPILQRHDDAFVDRPSKAVGVTFDELVDRLLAPRMSRADQNFFDVFLCLYRKFAAPSELFSAILVRLDRVKDDKAEHYLIKTEVQLRIVHVIATWVLLYPGDFARPSTRRQLEELIRHLSTEPIFVAAAQQMLTQLQQRVMEDDDTGWAKSDEREDELGMGEAGSDADAGSRRPSQLTDSMGSIQLDDFTAAYRRQSQGSELSGSDRDRDRETGRETTPTRTPARFQFHSFEDYEREAATMVPTATHPMNKFRYHIFMGLDPDDIADEMTRIDWVMFSSIRIRDLVRHVSMPLEQRERCKSLQNVNRMVAHFNHVARWVANMVLIRDKAKHRAPCLEKFMMIALKLRQLNNYNGLAAVLAGINGSSVHRLSQTYALVSPDVLRRFARLGLLMGTQKSHFAYRLAWENSPLPRIPFMPLHRRDLVSAEEGSRTFVGAGGDRINWKKFEVLGEVVLPIMKSQSQPYPNLNRHEPSRELILGCRMLADEEELYQRSIQVEPVSGNVADSSKKKFPWLAK